MSTGISAASSLTQTPSAEQSSTSSLPPSLDAQEEPSLEEIQLKPWKFIGYNGYSKFIASDTDFFIDQISALEEELAELDRKYSRRDAEDVNNGTFRDDLEDRTALLDTISDELYRYNKHILQQSSLRQFSKAPMRDIKNIRTWQCNYDNAAISERGYLTHEEDLICVVKKDKMPLRRMIDSSRRLRTLRIWRQPSEDGSPPDDDTVQYYLDKRMDGFATGVIIAVGIVMLITPLWVLQFMANTTMKLVVITVFILAFLLMLSFAMASKPFEALGATAAYAAVLMVFIQVGSPS